MVRRLKRHVKDRSTGEPIFLEREVIPAPVTADPVKHGRYRALHRSLLDLVGPELKRAFRARRYSDVLSFFSLLKRSVSTVAALTSTLAVVGDRYQEALSGGAETQESRRQRLRALRDYQRKLDRFGVISPEEEAERERLEAEDLALRLADMEREVRAGSRTLKRIAGVTATLDDLLAAAEEAGDEDPKLDYLLLEVHGIRSKESDANILIYTEYTTSQRAVAKALAAANVGEVVTMSGDDDEETRRKVTNRFRTESTLVLVSTDTAAEGLNLHQRCHHLIHLELPFNPNRLEQRNGRIDRYGQRKIPIIRYLFLRGSFEQRILLRLIAKVDRQRTRLTFIPNTLGIPIATEAGEERLLKALLDGEEKLFDEEDALFDFRQADLTEDAGEGVREILEEIDRSLSRYEKAARSHGWLGEEGLNAGAEDEEEASGAKEQGAKFSSTDLARFVTEAGLLEGGDLAGSVSDPIFELRLPPPWRQGAEDVPGYDPTTGAVRLTTHLDIERDEAGREVGFLGRAHPLVRRALDRVRNRVLGGTVPRGEDIRASAVRASVPRPTLLLTYLGRLRSGAGRELERVLAVEVAERGAVRFQEDPSMWLGRADLSKGVDTSGLWKKSFAGWADDAGRRAREAAREGFHPMAQRHAQRLKDILEREKVHVTRWLSRRAEEITGEVVTEAAQMGLFEEEGAGAGALVGSRPAWTRIEDPDERLAAYARDRAQPRARRSEAEGVLRIHKERLEDIRSRLDLNDPEILPLGILMLLPEEGQGA